jgi:hypothetical protein
MLSLRDYGPNLAQSLKSLSEENIDVQDIAYVLNITINH